MKKINFKELKEFTEDWKSYLEECDPEDASIIELQEMRMMHLFCESCQNLVA